ncbi:nucleotidyltransferase domain-containing protein [Vibrio sp. CAIM 722]|uniref:Nucleotidyltransferase domain-containing protein n=1 Tax=Vibrio eleionomae TaxID=2653505 RepID=A0A7X4LNQ7_9VIBR|nr:nucleotidyltransferase domain-containing protein [Vibrio eleionomae]
MREKILENLQEIEQKEDICILYACESGSRAWGFPSADSDYDVRFIYVRNRDWYLRVDHEYCRDVVEQPISELLDINGWDLKKALKLLRKSNPALIEWLNSPMVYRQNDEFTQALKQLVPQFYNPRACFYHYSHMAKGNFREFLQGEIVRVKKYFYVLRPILAMKWIEQNRGVVPMEFEVLVNELITDNELKQAITKLLDDKRQGFESAYAPRIDLISDFISNELDTYENKAQEQDKTLNDFTLLNQFFIETIDGKFSPSF